MKRRSKICFVSAVPISVYAFLRDHILELSKSYDVYVAFNCSQGDVPEIQGVKGVFHIPIQRGISICSDVKALCRLTKYFRRMRFDAVHSVTPKAGLLTSLAARMCGVPHRIHIFTGQVWATRKGMMRFALKKMDWLVARLDNHLLVDGESQRRFLVSEGVLSEKKARVLGAGSICGVDTQRFMPTLEERERQRSALEIPRDKVVYTFMGRLNRDKGVFELLYAFNNLAKYAADAYLLVFGCDEEKCLDTLYEYSNIKAGLNFKYYGRTSTPHLSLQASDVFCLPSYREGFGMSVVEASCLGLPVICSDAYGLQDTMVDGDTGMRCKVGDTVSLEAAMKFFYDNPKERLRMGLNGRQRVLELFPSEKIIGAWIEYYNSLLCDL